MPESIRRSDPVPQPDQQTRRLDRVLLASVLLPPVAVGMNTIVGYTVSHWVCDIDRKTTTYLVSFVDLLLCALAAAFAYWASRNLASADDTTPSMGRRNFMMRMGFTLAGFAGLVVLAQTLWMFTMASCD
jgi:hypothetical protein